MSKYKYFTINGVTKTVREWAEESGVKRTTLIERIKRGIPVEHILDKQLIKRPYKKRTTRVGTRDALPYSWSDAAVSCYEIGCTCSWCGIVPGDMKKFCKMKDTVMELVRRYGKPERKRNER